MPGKETTDLFAEGRRRELELFELEDALAVLTGVDHCSSCKDSREARARIKQKRAERLKEV